jgi:lipid II:glycine glycyltransferase (peptidoglycan interpeptide bridge formation enzyme)
MKKTGLITDLRQSPSYANFMRKIGWEVVATSQVKAFVRKTPLGSLVRIPRPNLPLPLEEIEQLAKKRKAMLVKIEPNLLLENFNPEKQIETFRKDSQPVLPTRTIWIDLTTNIDKLWDGLDKGSRNLVRRAEKEGVVISESKDLEGFYKLWEGNARKKHFFTPFEKELQALWESFSERHLLLAKYKGKVVAAVLLFGYKEAIYYSFAASNDSGRKVYAPYFLMWEVIKRSKGWGYARLDLEGIADPDVGRTKGWAGFSHFKKGFGGREVRYVGSFSKSYSVIGKMFGRFV